MQALPMAHAIAARFGMDGQNWYDDDGHELTLVCHDASIDVAHRGHGDDQRFTFADGTVITVLGAAWDLGFAGCWCWQGAGHHPNECELLRCDACNEMPDHCGCHLLMDEPPGLSREGNTLSWKGSVRLFDSVPGIQVSYDGNIWYWEPLDRLETTAPRAICEICEKHLATVEGFCYPCSDIQDGFAALGAAVGQAMASGLDPEDILSHVKDLTT